MKIVHQPKKSPEWAREFQCNGKVRAPGCGAVILVEHADLSVEHKHDIQGPRNIVFASCCVCGTRIVVEDPKVGDWGELPSA